MKRLGLVAVFLVLGSVNVYAGDCNSNGVDDTLEFDGDGDGVINACDNCLLVANANQLDTNNDGYGNVCDADLDNNGAINFIDVSLFSEVFLSNDPDADLNGDGAVNFLDLGVLTPFFLDVPGPGLPEAAVTPDADLVDVDGNVYRTLRFNDQIWMAENLKTTALNDGANIELYEFGDDWNENNITFIVPRYRFSFVSDPQLPPDYFGALYNTASMNSGKLCPVGWRIPSEQDWAILEAFVASDGFEGVEADALKATTSWSVNQGLDAFGFSLLASGYVTVFGGATGGPVVAFLATSDVNLADNQRKGITFVADQSSMLFDDINLVFGMAVRCIKN